jgi:hypothetical protein
VQVALEWVAPRVAACNIEVGCKQQHLSVTERVADCYTGMCTRVATGLLALAANA